MSKEEQLLNIVHDMQRRLDRAWETVRIVDSLHQADEVYSLLERIDSLEQQNNRLREKLAELGVDP